MIEPNVMRDAAEYLKNYYSDPDRKCLDILFEFRRSIGMTNDTIIVIHKRMEKGWGQPTSYSYEDLTRIAKSYGQNISGDFGDE